MKILAAAAGLALLAGLSLSDGAQAAPTPLRPESSSFLGVLDSLHASILTIVAVPEAQRAAPPGVRRKRLIGTGVATNDRDIVTTAGLAFPDADVRVLLGGGVERRATLRGVDRQSNLAVFRLDEPILHSLRRSPPQSLAVGTWVAVISNITVSRPQAAIGQVVGRGERVDFPYSGDVLEIDAPGYPASAGGAVLNEDGEWVALIVGRGVQGPRSRSGRVGAGPASGASTDVLLAVPVHQVDRIVSDLVEHGMVQRGFIGLRLKRAGTPVSPGDTLGVRVDGVIPGSPAADAGIREGDLVLAMDGQEVRTIEELVTMVSALRPGYDTEATILREGEILPVRIVIGSNFSGPRRPRSEDAVPPQPAPRTEAQRKAIQENLNRLKEQQRALEERLRRMESGSADSAAGSPGSDSR